MLSFIGGVDVERLLDFCSNKYPAPATPLELLRVFGRIWAGEDELRTGFVDSLAILPLGHKIGEWPIRLLATTGYELVTKVAALADTDRRGNPLPEPNPPTWHSELDGASARFFWSRPTLEPSLVVGNEVLLGQAFDESGMTRPDEIRSESVDAAFRAQPEAKGEFAIALARIMDAGPAHIAEMFDWLSSAQLPLDRNRPDTMADRPPPGRSPRT